MRWDDERYQGDAYGTYAWAVYVAEVTVDLTTFEIRVDDFVAVQEVGSVINPVLAAGQIEGGVAQAIGWALYEQVVVARRADGQRPDDQLHHADVAGPAADPRVLRGAPVPVRPGGAKGIGELPMDGPAPAILNAVAHATGLDPVRAAADARVADGADRSGACLTSRSRSAAASTAPSGS